MNDGKMHTAQVRRRRWSSCLLAILSIVCMLAAREAGRAEDAAPAGRPLTIAFASLRERPAFSNLYVYRHDGVSAGKIIGSIPAAFERADSHPSLSAGGAICAYASKQVGGFSPLIHLWDVKASRQIQGPP